MIDLSEVGMVGAAVAVAAWAVKDMWKGRGKKLDSKVDSALCDERTKNVHARLDDIKTTIDDIHDFLLKGGKR